MTFDPNELAVDYYFGDLSYWKRPLMAVDALEAGYDGNALRRLAGLSNPVGSDIRSEDVDAAFREMGVAAPISKDRARLVLAAKSAAKVTHGDSNPFDEATHIRIHLCELKDPPDELRRIVGLSKEAKSAPRGEWERIESELKDAFSDFLKVFA